MDRIKVFLLLIWTVAVTRAVGAADVTIVYKFNTLRSDNPTPQYLNTCSVSVYLQDNDQGLPLFENKHGHSFYRWIPPLYNSSGGSGWQFKSSNGTLDSILQLDLNTTFTTNVDSPEVFRKMLMKIQPSSFRILAKKQVTKDGFIDDVSNDLNEGSTFVGVTFTRKTAQTQPFYLSIHYGVDDNMYVYIRVSDVLSVRRKNPNGTYTFSNDYTSYEQDEHGIIHESVTVYMSVNSEKVIVMVANDTKIYKVYFTDMHIPRDFGKPLMVKHEYALVSSGDPVSYKLVQLYTNENNKFVSPVLDVKTDTSLFMLVYALRYNNKLPNETLINAYIDEVPTINWKLQLVNSNQLKYQVVNQSTIMKYSDDKNNDSPWERVLLKIFVRSPDNWIGLKQIRINISDPLIFIANIWEGRDEHRVRISNKTNCWNSDENVIYSTPAAESSTNASLSSYSSCYNGGRLHASYCVCPPGFIGNQCQTPCGSNLFGSNCSIVCSRSSSECQGMVICTPMYGCSCYPGYYGAQCTLKCEKGYYGADCKQSCSQGCESGCDIYTGNCRGSCATPYLIGPKCEEFHPYLRDPPMVVDSSFRSVHLRINLTESNVIDPFNYYNSPIFYIVQYREETNNTWTNSSRRIFQDQIERYVVDTLTPGHFYFFRVLLVDLTMKTHDPNMAKLSKVYTKCNNSHRDGSLKATKVTNTSVYLTWEPEQENECPAISYILLIEEEVDDFLEISQINNISRTFYEINNLVPSQLYRINLKKLTLQGESDPIASINVTTDGTIDFTKEIAGVTMIRDYNRVVLKWYASAIYKTFYVKYILNRHLSCSNDDVHYPLEVHVTNQTTFILSYENLDPYSHYYIFLTPDEGQNLNFHNYTFITRSQLPKVAPSLLENKIKVTNESIYLYLANSSSCEGMNGVLLKYFISYYDSQNKRKLLYETVDNPIVLMNLQPSTEYFAKIYYVNNIGYNKDRYLEYNFITKSTTVLVAKELTAYKTSADLIGLRWKLPETNLTITGSNISLHTDIWNKPMSYELGLDTMKKCSAWPSYICFDVTDLKPNVKYNITVDTFSNETSESGSSNPISAITKEGIASPVEDIKIEQVFQTNITISWKIPYMLNGILRKFVIQVEHLSSFNESLCCESSFSLDHKVSGEQQEYSHVLSNVYSASSYQITIRPYTRRVGSPLSKIVETPPPLQSLKFMPQIKINNRNAEFKEIDNADSLATDHELVKGILILVQELSHGSESNGNLGQLGFRREISQILKSNSWWLTHVCITSEENCSVDLGVTQEESEDPNFGMVLKKQLLMGQEYRVIIVQVNQYMSARSYTIAFSDKQTISDG